MPKASLSAHAPALPALTRRGFLAGSAAALATPQAAAATLAPTSAAATQADAELTALGLDFEQALAAYEAAQRHLDDCEARYVGRDPPCPVALTQQGPLGHRLACDWEWWSARELRALLADPDARDDWDAARAVLPVARAYEARLRRLSRAIGLDAAEAAYRAAGDALDDLGVRVADAPARSLGGLAVKARVVKRHAAPEWWSEVGTAERIAAQALDAVMAMAGGP
jgi:hypothetical protein